MDIAEKMDEFFASVFIAKDGQKMLEVEVSSEVAMFAEDTQLFRVLKKQSTNKISPNMVIGQLTGQCRTL